MSNFQAAVKAQELLREAETKAISRLCAQGVYDPRLTARPPYDVSLYIRNRAYDEKVAIMRQKIIREMDGGMRNYTEEKKAEKPPRGDWATSAYDR